MAKKPKHSRNIDLAAFLIGLVDDAFMAFYGHMRRNARRLTRLGVAMLPLMMLLVGSCKVEEVSDNFAGQGKTAQLRAALFPDRAMTRDGHYHPAGGYVTRALKYIESSPDSLNNLTEQEIGYLYGKPSMERRDADARVWQYKTETCVVDFFFYDDKAAQDSSPVSYVDYRLRQDLDPGAEPRTGPVPGRGQAKCLKKIAGGDFATYSN